MKIKNLECKQGEKKMSKKVLIPIADGTEELEAVGMIDTLRRAGALVTVASVQKKEITGANGIKIVADKVMAECACEEYDLIALPGGLPLTFPIWDFFMSLLCSSD
jgi:protein deglycase